MLLKTEWVLYLSERSAEETIGFHIENRLNEEDVQRYRSVIEGAIAQFGCVRLLFAFDNLSAADLREMWDELKFSTQYLDDIERIALVGDEQVERWIDDAATETVYPEIRYFACEEYDDAWEWLGE
jgi:hypothetical protein